MITIRNSRYRYIDIVTEEGIELHLEEYLEMKKTPRGAWVQMFYMGHAIGKKRFVLDGVGRRLCHQTKEQAWESFKTRKRRQYTLARHSLERAEYSIEQMEKIEAAPEKSLVFGKPDFWHQYTFD